MSAEVVDADGAAGESSSLLGAVGGGTDNAADGKFRLTDTTASGAGGTDNAADGKFRLTVTTASGAGGTDIVAAGMFPFTDTFPISLAVGGNACPNAFEETICWKGVDVSDVAFDDPDVLDEPVGDCSGVSCSVIP